ncbi:hypothetical protein Tco_1385710 [Tanacetum coccineum]
MAALKFASSHNMFAFLDKPTKSGGFEQIVDFLNAHPIKYALTVNPTIYTACIEQFWTTAKVQTVNGEVQIQALVDKKKVIITKTSIRTDLQLADENGTECLPNATIFAELERMGDTPLSQPSTSQSQKKQPRRKQSKDIEVYQLSGPTEPITDEAANKEHVPTHYNDPLLSESSKDEVLGNQEDASKQGRKIADLDADTEVALVDEAQGRNDDNLMFDTGVLDEQEVEVEVVVSIAEVTTTSATTTTVDELMEASCKLYRKEQEELAIDESSEEKFILSITETLGGYKQNQLKSKNYDEIQKLFDKAMTRVNMFVDMDTELVKESSKKAEMYRIVFSIRSKRR